VSVQLIKRLAVYVCLAVPVTAAARTAADAELLIGGGRDNGLFPLAVQLLPPGVVTDDFFFETRPSTGLHLEPGENHRLGLAYAGSYRRFATPENGWAHAHLLHGSYAFDLVPALTLEAGLLGATEQFTAVDSGYLLGGGMLGTTWEPTRGLRIGVRGETQWIDSPALRGMLGGGAATVKWSGESCSLGASGRWRTAGPGWHQASGGIEAGLTLGPLFGRAELRGGGFSGGLWLGWRGALAWRIAEHWSLVATYDGSHLDYTDGTGTLTAHVGGLGARFAWESAPGVERLLDRVARGRSERPSPSGMTLRVHAPEKSRSLDVVADFNGWAHEPLEPSGPGVWELRVDRPAGRYAFQLLVDGEICVPTGAQAYRPDGFGGQNAVLVIGEAAAAEVHCHTIDPQS